MQSFLLVFKKRYISRLKFNNTISTNHLCNLRVYIINVLVAQSIFFGRCLRSDWSVQACNWWFFKRRSPDIKVIHSIWRSLDNRDIQKASLLNFLKNFNEYFSNPLLFKRLFLNWNTRLRFLYIYIFFLEYIMNNIFNFTSP